MNKQQDPRIIQIGKAQISRRQMLLGAGGAAIAGGLLAARGFHLHTIAGWSPVVRFGDVLNRRLQRAFMPDRPLAPEFRLDQLTANFPQNGGFGFGYIEEDPAYDAMLANGFRDWRLSVEGLVSRPARFSLEDLRAMPQRTQITMHCCDMGWSAIGQWTGVPLRWLLEHVGIRDQARYLVFYCLDRLKGGTLLYSSIDRLDAFHPQTILAHGMNGATLPRKHGAPLRLRIELQIGYKNSKHIQRIVAVDSLKGIHGGFGGTFEDMGYQWFAGM